MESFIWETLHVTEKTNVHLTLISSLFCLIIIWRLTSLNYVFDNLINFIKNIFMYDFTNQVPQVLEYYIHKVSVKNELYKIFQQLSEII